VVTNPDRTERSRRAILDAARPVFERSGYAAASLNRIIEASGLTKGGFYFHFPSKQALALAVLEDHHRRWIGAIREQISAHPRAVDRLFAAPRAIARATRAGEGPAALQKLVSELAQDPDLRDQVCNGSRIWIETVTEHFRAAQEEGSVRADLEPALFAEVAVAGFTGMQSLTGQFDDDGLERRAEHLVRVLRLAVLTDQEARRT
jgi:AcrR family transcriptional regulator